MGLVRRRFGQGYASSGGDRKVRLVILHPPSDRRDNFCLISIDWWKPVSDGKSTLIWAILLCIGNEPLKGNFRLQLAGRSMHLLNWKKHLMRLLTQNLPLVLSEREMQRSKRRLFPDRDQRPHLARSRLVTSNPIVAISSQMVSEARTEEIHARAETVEEENKRLRADNERLTRVIDSGDWGRARADELVRAGEVLSGERDALTKLIGRLQREHASVQDGKRRQEEEMRSMKDKMLSGVSGSSLLQFAKNKFVRTPRLNCKRCTKIGQDNPPRYLRPPLRSDATACSWLLVPVGMMFSRLTGVPRSARVSYQTARMAELMQTALWLFLKQLLSNTLSSLLSKEC
jgi:hypothetical protein